MSIFRRAPENTYWYEPRPRIGARASRLLALGAATALLGGAAFAANAGAASDEHKVTICHATASRTNPYVLITVDYHSVTQGGHGDHDGPVFDASQDQGKWGDIIPSFDLGKSGAYPGKNVTDGAAILANGCRVVEATTTTTEPTTTTTDGGNA
jgi:hypothetical protein